MGPTYPNCGAGDAGGNLRRRPGVSRKIFPMILPLMILFQSPFCFSSRRSRGGECSESLEAESWGAVNAGRCVGRRMERTQNARQSASSRRRYDRAGVFTQSVKPGANEMEIGCENLRCAPIPGSSLPKNLARLVNAPLSPRLFLFVCFVVPTASPRFIPASHPAFAPPPSSEHKKGAEPYGSAP